jgi:hypothetical protein
VVVAFGLGATIDANQSLRRRKFTVSDSCHYFRARPLARYEHRPYALFAVFSGFPANQFSVAHYAFLHAIRHSGFFQVREEQD